MTGLGESRSAGDDGLDELLEALRAENDALRVRVATLEAATDEYRRQMHEVLTSASWRSTAIFRGAIGKVRLTRRRLRSLPRRLHASHRSQHTPTTGLFAPANRHPSSGVTHISPLLRLPLMHGARSPRLSPEPRTTTARVLVVAHVYYAEVWPDSGDGRPGIPEPFAPTVPRGKGRAEALEPHIPRRIPNARVLLVENRGRDSGPLVDL